MQCRISTRGQLVPRAGSGTGRVRVFQLPKVFEKFIAEQKQLYKDIKAFEKQLK